MANVDAESAQLQKDIVACHTLNYKSYAPKIRADLRYKSTFVRKATKLAKNIRVNLVGHASTRILMSVGYNTA